MQFANYDAFRASVQRLIEGDDTIGTFSVDTLDLLIGLGEARVYHGDDATAGLRSSTMIQPLSATVTANAADLPADLLELKEVFFAGEKPLDIVPIEELRTKESIGGGGDSRLCAQDGETLRFYPAASGTVEGRYYAKPAALESGLNSTFNRYPELFVFAALIESAPFLGMNEKFQVWEAKYRSLADGANHSELVRVYGAARLKVRAR